LAAENVAGEQQHLKSAEGLKQMSKLHEELLSVSASKNRGGVVDLTQIHPELSAWISTIVGDFTLFCRRLKLDHPRGRGVNVRVGISEDLRYNAWTCIEGDFDYIFLSASVISWLRRTVSIMSKNGFGFEYFGRWQNPPGTVNIAPFPNEISFYDEFQLGDKPTLPNQFEAVHVAMVCSLATHFILHHELAHIWNGHVEYSSKKSQFNAFSEDDLWDEKYDIDSYGFEMDADCLAVRGCFLWACNRYQWPTSYFRSSIPDASSSAEEMKSFVGMNMSLGFITVAFYLSIRLALYVRGVKMADMRASHKHPPLFFRVTVIYHELAGLLKEITGEDPTVAQVFIQETIKRAEHAFCASTGEEPIDLFSDDIQRSYLGMYEKIRDRWAEIHGDLSQYIRGHQLRRFV
jgi:hypothetical protein